MPYIVLTCIVVIAAIFVLVKIHREHMQVDETRTVDYPVYQDKSVPLESNPDRTPDQVPKTGPPEMAVNEGGGDGQIKNIDPIGWSVENDFMI